MKLEFLRNWTRSGEQDIGLLSGVGQRQISAGDRRRCGRRTGERVPDNDKPGRVVVCFGLLRHGNCRNSQS